MTTPLVTFRGHRGGVNTLLCEEDKHANVLASGSDDGSCRLWDVRTTRATRSMNIRKALGVTAQDDPSESAVNSLAFSGNGDCIHVAVSNKVLTFDLRQEGLIFDCASKEILQDNEDEINSLARHPGKQGKYLSAPDDNGDIRVYDMEAHRLYKTLRGQHANICSAAPFRPNAPWDLVSGGMDGFLLFWDFSRGRMKFKIDLNAGINSLDSASSTDDTAGVNRMFNPPLVHSIAFAPNGKSFAAGLGDASIALVEFNSKQVVRRLKQHSAAVSQVHFPAFRPSEWLISCGNDAKICIWDYQKALSSSSSQCAGDEVNEAADTISNDGTHPDIVKEFAVAKGPNAISSCLHQNLVLVSDVSNVISAYPVL
ncbi:Wd40 repeat-like protein [Globisporangium polare]